MPRVLALTLTIAACLWAAALLIAPAMSASGSAAAAAVYRAASGICHQRGDRSFLLAGVQMPVCARCTGLYASGAAGAALAWIIAAPRLERSRRLLAASALPTFLTIGAEWSNVAQPSSAVRALAALPLGAVAAWLFVGALRAEERRRRT